MSEIVKSRMTREQLEELKRIWADESEDPEEWEPETEDMPRVEEVLKASPSGTIMGHFV